MTQNYFGYDPGSLPPQYAQYDDYKFTERVEYAGTAWTDPAIDINLMWEVMKAADDEAVRGLATMWARFETMLASVHESLLKHGQLLEQHWNSPAGQEFLRRVGAALYSIQQWKEAAASNKVAVNHVAEQMGKTQAEVRQIWVDYTQEEAHMKLRRAEEDAEAWYEFWNWGNGGDILDKGQVIRKYTDRARPKMQALSDTYVHQSFAMTRGSTYKGPVTYKPVNVDDLRRAAGGPGGFPTVPSLPPPLPPLDSFIAPEGPELAGVGPLPAPPTMPPIPGVPGSGAPGLPAGLPGLPAFPGGPGPVGPAGSRPSLPGQGGRPTLPGSSGRSGAPGAPGAPGRPNLKGQSKAGQAPSMPPGSGRVPPKGSPRQQSAASRRLSGRRAGATGEPHASGPPKGGSPLSGRRAGGAGPVRRLINKILPSKGLTPPTPPPAPPAAPKPPTPAGKGALDGRRGAQTGAGRGAGSISGRRRGGANDRRRGTDVVSDENLWAVEPAAADLDTPPEPRPPTPGPAIGRNG